MKGRAIILIVCALLFLFMSVLVIEDGKPPTAEIVEDDSEMLSSVKYSESFEGSNRYILVQYSEPKNIESINVISPKGYKIYSEELSDNVSAAKINLDNRPEENHTVIFTMNDQTTNEVIIGFN